MIQTGMSDKWEETKAKGEAEASRRQAFELGTALPLKSYKEGPYLPRAPMKKKIGAIEKVSQDLGLATEPHVVIKAEKKEVIKPAAKEVGKEEEKMRRLLQARQRRKKN